jgi:hypothetical protein
MKKEINYQALVDNCDSMINTLEYDAMRSAGKAKLNSDTLMNLHSLKERYLKNIPTPKKEVK